jgi:threonine aldolase
MSRYTIVAATDSFSVGGSKAWPQIVGTALLVNVESERDADAACARRGSNDV